MGNIVEVDRPHVAFFAGLKYVGESGDHMFGYVFHKFYMWCCVN